MTPLRDLYVKQKRSLRAIGRLYGIDPRTVAQKLAREGVELRPGPPRAVQCVRFVSLRIEDADWRAIGRRAGRRGRAAWIREAIQEKLGRG